MKKTIYIAFDGKEFNDKEEYKKYQKETLEHTKWFNTIRTTGSYANNEYQDRFCVFFENEEEFKQCSNFLEINNNSNYWDGPGIYLAEYYIFSKNGKYVIESLTRQNKTRLQQVENYKKRVERDIADPHGRFSYDFFRNRLEV